MVVELLYYQLMESIFLWMESVFLSYNYLLLSLVIYSLSLDAFSVQPHLCGCMYATGCSKNSKSCCNGLTCQNIDSFGNTQCVESLNYFANGCVQTNQNGCKRNSDCCNPFAVCSTYKNCIMNQTCTYYYTSSEPSSQPSSLPTLQPFDQPTYIKLSFRPTSQPTSQPSYQPNRKPTSQPGLQPIGCPTKQPSRQPSLKPKATPSNQPTGFPWKSPGSNPTSHPTLGPLCRPTHFPSTMPTRQPNMLPSSGPSFQPLNSPSTCPIRYPSADPTCSPFSQPSNWPSNQYSASPSSQPFIAPSEQPNPNPSRKPGINPTDFPSKQIPLLPTSQPSLYPSIQLSLAPTACPSEHPILHKTHSHSCQPSKIPQFSYSSSYPSIGPSTKPSLQPTLQQTNTPSQQPSQGSSESFRYLPINKPSDLTTASPSFYPFYNPSGFITARPMEKLSKGPTQSYQRTSESPSYMPFNNPSDLTTVNPIATPTSDPSQSYQRSSESPSLTPNNKLPDLPTVSPTERLTNEPSQSTSLAPTLNPSLESISMVPTSTLTTLEPSEQPSLEQPSLSWPSPLQSISITLIPSSSELPDRGEKESTYPSTLSPTVAPFIVADAENSSEPSFQPSDLLSSVPTVATTLLAPSIESSPLPPSTLPHFLSSDQPTATPSSESSISPFNSFEGDTTTPSYLPSFSASQSPSAALPPSGIPTEESINSGMPTDGFTIYPTIKSSSTPPLSTSQTPTSSTTGAPSQFNENGINTGQSTAVPSFAATAYPIGISSSVPQNLPSVPPSIRPSIAPSSEPSVLPVRLSFTFLVMNLTSPTLSAGESTAFLSTIANIMSLNVTYLSLSNVLQASRKLAISRQSFALIATIARVPLSLFPQLEGNTSQLLDLLASRLEIAVVSGQATALFREKLNYIGIIELLQPAITAVFVGDSSIPMPSLSPTTLTAVARDGGSSGKSCTANSDLFAGGVTGGALFFSCLLPIIILLSRKSWKKKKVANEAGANPAENQSQSIELVHQSQDFDFVMPDEMKMKIAKGRQKDSFRSRTDSTEAAHIPNKNNFEDGFPSAFGIQDVPSDYVKRLHPKSTDEDVSRSSVAFGTLVNPPKLLEDNQQYFQGTSSNPSYERPRQKSSSSYINNLLFGRSASVDITEIYPKSKSTDVETEEDSASLQPSLPPPFPATLSSPATTSKKHPILHSSSASHSNKHSKQESSTITVFRKVSSFFNVFGQTTDNTITGRAASPTNNNKKFQAFSIDHSIDNLKSFDITDLYNASECSEVEIIADRSAMATSADTRSSASPAPIERLPPRINSRFIKYFTSLDTKELPPGRLASRDGSVLSSKETINSKSSNDLTHVIQPTVARLQSQRSYFHMDTATSAPSPIRSYDIQDFYPESESSFKGEFAAVMRTSTTVINEKRESGENAKDFTGSPPHRSASSTSTGLFLSSDRTNNTRSARTSSREHNVNYHLERLAQATRHQQRDSQITDSRTSLSSGDVSPCASPSHRNVQKVRAIRSKFESMIQKNAELTLSSPHAAPNSLRIRKCMQSLPPEEFILSDADCD